MINIKVPLNRLEYYNKLNNKKDRIDSFILIITPDSNMVTPIITITEKTGKMVEWGRGEKLTKDLIKYGYNRIKRKCPYRLLGLFDCTCEKCHLYIIDNLIGDCSHKWIALASIPDTEGKIHEK